jgi:hypothetical protein
MDGTLEGQAPTTLEVLQYHALFCDVRQRASVAIVFVAQLAQQQAWIHLRVTTATTSPDQSISTANTVWSQKSQRAI